MKIELNSAEFSQAVECYLVKQGFTINRYNISVNVIRGIGENSTRAEIQLDPVKPIKISKLDENLMLFKTDNVPFESALETTTETTETVETVETVEDTSDDSVSPVPMGALFGTGVRTGL